MERPCFNPDSIIYPERDEPYEMPPRSQKTAKTRAREREQPIVILNWEEFHRKSEGQVS